MQQKRLIAGMLKSESLEVVGCDYCLNNEIGEITLPEFTYNGSALATFTVKNAVVSKCPACGFTFYSRSEAIGWEIAKALELALRVPAKVLT